MVDANALNKSGATGTMHKNRVHGTERFPRFLLSYSFRKIHLILRENSFLQKEFASAFMVKRAQRLHLHVMARYLLSETI